MADIVNGICDALMFLGTRVLEGKALEGKALEGYSQRDGANSLADRFRAPLVFSGRLCRSLGGQHLK
jgi:hypothetical protein